MLVIGSGDYTHGGFDTIYDITINDFITPDIIILEEDEIYIEPIFGDLPFEIKINIFKRVFDLWMNSLQVKEAYKLSTMNREIFYFLYNQFRKHSDRKYLDIYEWRNMLHLLDIINQHLIHFPETTNEESFYGFEITHIRAFNSKNITPYSNFLGIQVVEYTGVYNNYINVKTGSSLIDNALIKGKMDGYGLIKEDIIMLPCVCLRIVDQKGNNHFTVKDKKFGFHESWLTFAKLFKLSLGKYSELLIEMRVKRGDIYTSRLVSFL